MKFLLIAYVVICLFLYFVQEKLLFFPDKLPKDFRFSFDQPFKEVNVEVSEGKMLNGLLFGAPNSKGLVFYLHGNAGALDSWGEVAGRYTRLNYDVFILDYPGYGKSDGSIKGEKSLHEDIQAVYDTVKKQYMEEKIVVLGYSIGTGPAAKLASSNKPAMLILQAPYFSLPDIMRRRFPVIPTFLLKYRFQTGQYIQECTMPVVIFHGDRDEVIYFGSSLKLQEKMKSTDRLIRLEGQGHNGISDNPRYLSVLAELLR